MIYIEEKTTKKVPGITSFFVKFDYNPVIVDVIKTVPSSIFHEKEKIWEIPLTSLAEFIDKVCYVDSIDLKLLKYSENSPSLIYQQGDLKTTLFKHQLEGVSYGLNHDSWLLLDEPGLGKTLQILALAQELKEKRGLEHCLIVCGINTLKSNWKKEVETHTNLSCRILGEKISSRGNYSIGSVAERLSQLKKKIDEFFVITNIETLRNDDIIHEILKSKINNFDMIVVDEIHCCKSPTSQQGKNLLKLCKPTYKVGATGTLLLNDPLDTYVPLKWIGADRSTYTNFKYYYCNFGGPFNNTLLGFKNINTLKFQLEKFSLRREKDLLDLPDKTVIVEYVDMNTSQKSFYDNVKAGLKEEVDKVKLNTANILSLVTRLRQATAFPGILTSDNIESSKITRIVDLSEQILYNNKKVVIFSTFKESTYEIARLLEKFNPVVCTGDQKDEFISDCVDKFQNDPECKVFIGTWQKCGTGITLNAASYMIFVDTPWTEGVFKQACDRIHRIGTKNPVFIYNIVAKDTFDERVLEILQNKRALSEYIIDDRIDNNLIENLKKYIEDL